MLPDQRYLKFSPIIIKEPPYLNIITRLQWFWSWEISSWKQTCLPDCGFPSRLRSRSVSIMRWQGSWSSFHLRQKMQMALTLRCTSIRTLRDLTRELIWTSREPSRYLSLSLMPFTLWLCTTVPVLKTVFLRTKLLRKPIRWLTENKWWQSSSGTKQWHWRTQTMMIMICTCIWCKFIGIYLSLWLFLHKIQWSLMYKEGEMRGTPSKRPKKLILGVFFPTACFTPS